MNSSLHDRLRCFDVEVTRRCDLGCRHCYLGPGEPGDMGKDTAEQVLAAMQGCLAWQLNLYGGEPLLNWDTLTFLVDHSPAQKTLFTNGASATRSEVRWLRDRGVVAKRSTAGCPEAAALTRPGSYTDRWLEEGRWWEDQRATHRLVVTPATVRTVVNSVRWLHLNGYTGPVDLATDDYAPWGDADWWAYQDQLDRLVTEYVRQFRRGECLGIENFHAFGRCLYGQSSWVLGCGAMTNTVGVDYQGHLVPCHRFFREEAARGGTLESLALGKMPTYAVPFQEAILACRYRKEREECKVCEARACCPRGCMHVAWKVAGDPAASVAARCRATLLYARAARRIDRELNSLTWWLREPTACMPFGE